MHYLTDLGVIDSGFVHNSICRYSQVNIEETELLLFHLKIIISIVCVCIYQQDRKTNQKQKNVDKIVRITILIMFQ